MHSTCTQIELWFDTDGSKEVGKRQRKNKCWGKDAIKKGNKSEKIIGFSSAKLFLESKDKYEPTIITFWVGFHIPVYVLGAITISHFSLNCADMAVLRNVMQSMVREASRLMTFITCDNFRLVEERKAKWPPHQHHRCRHQDALSRELNFHFRRRRDKDDDDVFGWGWWEDKQGERVRVRERV